MTVSFPPPVEEILTDDSYLERSRRELESREKCFHCGGWHVRSCPRLKRLTMFESGKPKSFEYWRDDEWPKDSVIFPEDLATEEGEE